MSASNGAMALALDTDTLYVYSTNSNTWVPIADPGDVSAITALTGDGTANGPGSAPLTLATVNPNVGMFGDASHTSTLTVNAKGLTVAATSQAIQIAESQVTNLVSDLAGKQPVGNYITALTGDATASGPGSAALTLATVNANVGSFGDASHTTAITVNAKGLTTAIAAQSIQIAESQVTNLVSDLAGKQPTGNYITALTGDATASGPGSAALTLATVNANVGSFGSASSVGTFTVNAKGLTTAASSTSIQIAESQVTNLTTDLAAKVSSVGAVGSSPNANAASIAAGVLTLQPFSASFPGVVLASGGGSTNFLRADGTWATPPGTVSGTVTSVSVVSANGLAGTVATATTTPAITLSTTVNSPILAGNGTAIIAATTTGTGSTAVLSASPSLTGTLTVTAPNATMALSLVSGVGNLTYAAFSTTSFLQDSQTLVIGTTSANPLILRTNGATALTINSSQNATFAGTVAASNLSGTNTGDVTIGTANGLSLAGQVLSLALSSTSTTGALSSTDWNTFNGKQSALTLGNLTDAGTDGITITGGTGAVVGSGTSISQRVADTTHNGYLSSTDWNTFNGKQASGNYITALTGDVTASGPGSVAATLATVNSNVGSFGSSTSIPSFTVNGKGLITAASGNAVIAPAGTLSGTTLNSTVVNSSLTSVGTLASLTVTGNLNNTALLASNLVGTDASKNLTTISLPGNTSFLSNPSLQAYTSGSGTYTTPTFPSPLRLKVTLVGAGGGGGASGATTGGEAGGGGGGGGGTAYIYISSPAASYSYGVGAGGSGGVQGGAAAQPGGNTTFGTFTANGGGAGSVSTGITAPGAGATGGSTSGSPTISINGGSGGVGIFGVAATVQGPGGYGGASAFGGSGGAPTNGAGSAGIAFGAGGAGGAQASGGAGAAGYIFIEAFYQ